MDSQVTNLWSDERISKMKAMDIITKQSIIIGIDRELKKVTLYKNIFSGSVAEDEMQIKDCVEIFSRIIAGTSDITSDCRIFQEGLVISLEEAIHQVLEDHMTERNTDSNVNKV